MPPLLRSRERRGTLLVGVGTAVAIAVILIVGINSPVSPKGTVDSLEVRIVGQGTTPQGTGWFGTPELNYTGAQNGYPFNFGLGSSFNYSLQMANGDRSPHSVSSVGVNAPFRVLAVSPPLPYQVGGLDDFLLTVTLGTPTASGQYSVELTINTYG
ncbi:MAG TPA: hypothetical protein VGV89_10150 [Thermoplasmata archaeon]|nr:hypothetical protein [Thermoplasmata archaeon]